MTGNKETAVAFLKLCSEGRVEEAFGKFASPGFRHHNPYFGESAGALMKGMAEAARRNPEQAFDVKRAVEEGEFVAVHSHVRPKPGEQGAAVVHILKFDNGRISEMWDIVQPVPDAMSNKLGMF